MPRSLIHPQQINLRELFTVERVLAARGLMVSKVGPIADTMLGPDERGEAFVQLFFDSFSKSQVRYELLQVCNGSLKKESTFHSKPLIDNLLLGQQRFSKTLEWFIGENLVRKFGSFSSAFGVEIVGLADSAERLDIGDFDVVSVMGDSSLLYVECKSGAIDSEQILKATRRGRLIGSVATIIALSGKTGYMSMLKSLLGHVSHPEIGIPTTVFEISSISLADSCAIVWGNTYFLPLSSASLGNSLSTILRLIGQQRAGNYLYSVVGSAPFNLETQEMFRTMGFRIKLPYD